MNWLQTQIALLNTASAVVEFGVNWLVQATILITIGLAGGGLLRNRGSAAQSAVYRTTLIAALVCPIASWALALAGVSGWSISLPVAWTYEPAEPSVVEVASPGAIENEGATPNVFVNSTVRDSQAESIEVPVHPSVGENLPAGAPIVPSVEVTSDSLPAKSVNPEPAQVAMSAPAALSKFSVHAFGLAAVAIASVWLLGGLILLFRLSTAWWRLSLLRDAAAPADSQTFRSCAELAAQLAVRAPQVLRSPYLPSPCLAGLRKPAILLPEADLALSLRDVLIHELAHLTRRDCHWNLLRQLTLSAFYFQPLLWRLSQRLEATAEEVCDDYVVQFGGDRHEYAHRLVDVAELSTAPMAAAGVGIVSLRSMLARRVQRILDTSRSLSTRVGHMLLLVVLAVGITGTMIAGLLGVGPKRSVAEVASQPSGSDDTGEDQQVVQVAADEKEGNARQADADDDLITIRGRVLDSAGNPVDAATVSIVRWYWDPSIEHKPLNQTKSDKDGRFEINYRKSQFNVDVKRPEQWREVAVAGYKQGYGPDWLWWDKVSPGEQAELRLPADDLPITGRLLDLEGRPLAGVTVKVGGIQSPKKSDLSDWVQAVKNGEPPWTVAKHFRSSGLPFEGSGLPSELATDTDGRFRLTGLGRERTVSLEFNGPMIARTEATAATRTMSPISQLRNNRPNSESTPVLGADFTLTLPPTRAIEGVVRDADSGEVLKGVGVQSWKFGADSFINERHIRTVSDEQGHFNLVGMPKGAGNEIIAVPADDQPYFMRVAKVPDDPGLGPLTVNIELHRGIWITGRVTDRDTHKPVPNARLYYLPFLSNEFAQARTPEFSGGNVQGTNAYQDRYASAADGSYRLVGLPGRAIVGLTTIDGSYRQGMGAAEIEGLNEAGHFQTYRNPINPSRKWPTAMKEINPAADAKAFDVNFELDPGKQIEFETLDLAGQPISGVSVTGMSPDRYDPPTRSPKFVATAFGPDEERTILLHHEERRLGKVVRVRASAESQKIAVRLEPCATVKGRLVDENQQAVVGAEVRFDVLPSEDFNKRLDLATTDADGRFEHAGVPPGANYAVVVEGAKIKFSTLVKDLAVASGETIDLGTIDVTGDERPELVRTRSTQSENSSASSAKTAATATVDATTPDDQTSHEYTGKVVDPSDKPVSDAKLFLVFYGSDGTGLLTPSSPPVASTNPDGTFRFTIKPSDFGKLADQEFGYASLIAVKEGFGFAWSVAGRHATRGNWLEKARAKAQSAPAWMIDELKWMLSGVSEPLKLIPDDHPIRGRVVDINGQGVAGARLTLMEVTTSQNNDLGAWRAAAKEPKADYYSARTKTIQTINGPQVRSLVKPAVTGDDGRFELRGVGHGRIADLLVEAPGIETTILRARTEAGEKIELMREHQSPGLGTYIYYPADLVHVAGPSAFIFGVVRDANSKAPLAGVTIKSQARHGERINGWGQDFVRAVTDGEGRYQLAGMPIGDGNRIAAIGPRGTVPYLSMSKRAETFSRDRSVEVNFDLRPGVWVEGRITDKKTRKGLGGTLSYHVQKENPNYEFARTLNVDERDSMRSQSDGTFRIAVLPGSGYIGFMAHDHQKYPRAEAILKVDGSRQKADGLLSTRPSLVSIQNYHLLAEISPAADDERIVRNLELDDTQNFIGHIVDPDGQPITGVHYSGHMAQFAVWQALQNDTFELYGYDPATPRPVYFAHRGRNLAAYAIVEGPVREGFVVKLQSAGKVKGRLVDRDATPLANCQLMAWSPPRKSPEEAKGSFNAAPLPPNLVNWQSGQYETDEQGNFEIACLVPGVEYRLRAFERESMTASDRVTRFTGPLDVLIRVEPGEVKDLGDVRLVDEKSTAANSNPKKLEPATQPHSTVSGQITLSSGKPAAAAHVIVIAMRIQPGRGGDLDPRGDVLAAGATDANGQYRLTLKAANSKTHRYANIVARIDGHAIGWKPLNLDEPTTEAAIVLLPEEVKRGRLVDIEAQPAAGVRLVVQSIHEKTVGDLPSSHGVGFHGEGPSTAWLPSVTSDADGRFALLGIPAGYGVYLKSEGTEKFAPQDIALDTGMSEQRGERDGTYRPLVKNSAPGEEAVLALAPAQLFEGIVTYEDTHQPAPHARLTIWAGQQEFGSMYSLAGKADEHGRYRLSPFPGIRFGITAYPGDGEPYLARQLKPVKWKDGDVSRHVDVALPRGVLVRGTVVEAPDNKPVAGATIQYVPESSSKRQVSDEIVTGWQGIQLSNDQGKFEIVVLPGPGRLVVHGPVGRYVLQEASDNELSKGKPGGRRNYAHTFHRIEPANNSDPLDVTVSIVPGEKLTGRIVDEQGTPIEEALVITRLNISPLHLWWRGPITPSRGKQFELYGLEKNKEYPTHFLDSKHRLGAVQALRADGTESVVVLKPCGQATARFVDSEGNPHAKFDPALHIVITPGEHENDWAVANQGKLAADADFASNIDENYRPGPKTDEQGRVTFPSLIPGATYRLATFDDGKPRVLKQFSVQTGEKVDLGEFSIDLKR